MVGVGSETLPLVTRCLVGAVVDSARLFVCGGLRSPAQNLAHNGHPANFPRSEAVSSELFQEMASNSIRRPKHKPRVPLLCGPVRSPGQWMGPGVLC